MTCIGATDARPVVIVGVPADLESVIGEIRKGEGALRGVERSPAPNSLTRGTDDPKLIGDHPGDRGGFQHTPWYLPWAHFGATPQLFTVTASQPQLFTVTASQPQLFTVTASQWYLPVPPVGPSAGPFQSPA